MYKFGMLVAAVLLISGSASAQKSPKPFVEWNKKEAEKVLNDSAWGQTQTETDPSQMFYTAPSATTATGTNSSPGGEGSRNQAIHVRFRIRFFTAKPIRQALARLIKDQNQLDQAATAQLYDWASIHTDDYIIVAVSYEGDDRRYLGRVSQSFDSATTPILKNGTYLERKDGKRLFLSEYRPQKKDGFGAHFIFPRNLEGQPFVTPDSGSIRFHCELENKVTLDAQSNPAGQTSRSAIRSSSSISSSIQPENPFKIKLDMKFKIADMIYDGKLEY